MPLHISVLPVKINGDMPRDGTDGLSQPTDEMKATQTSAQVSY